MTSKTYCCKENASSGCCKESKNPIIVVEECSRKFTINNPNKEFVCQVLVDNCLMKGATERCDYLFEIGENCDSVIYVELKGADISKALRQLESTVAYTQSKHGSSRRFLHIVASRVPKAGPRIQELKVKIAKKTGIRLFVDTDIAYVNISKPPYS